MLDETAFFPHERVNPTHLATSTPRPSPVFLLRLPAFNTRRLRREICPHTLTKSLSQISVTTWSHAPAFPRSAKKMIDSRPRSRSVPPTVSQQSHGVASTDPHAA